MYGGKEEPIINAYSDATFQTNHDGSRSQLGFVFCLNGSVVSWKSSKQETVADYTTKFEYIVASDAAKEAIWIKKFIYKLGVVPSILDLVDLFCNNNGSSHKLRRPNHTRNPNTYSGDSISFER